MKNKEPIFSVIKKDFEVQHYKGSGPGGQSRNKNATAVRIIHKESGAVGSSEEMKSQYQNKQLAFDRLTKSDKFKIWLRKKTNDIVINKELEEYVEKWTDPWFLKVETRKNNKWTEEGTYLCE